MKGAYAPEEIRAAESALMARLPSGALMQRAAAGLAGAAAARLGSVYGARVLLLVGGGNNGGDALYAGARLARRGALVAAAGSGSAMHAAGLADLRAAGGRLLRDEADAAWFAQGGVDLVLDGMLGIGGRPGLAGPALRLARLAREARAAGAQVIAVDIPSGVDAATGWAPMEAGSAQDGAAVEADVTVTFGAVKIGLVAGVGRILAGQVQLVDIGLAATLPAPSVEVLEAADAAALLPAPNAASDKYTRGVVGVIAGSGQYGGAAVLATGSALRGGAGMVRYAGDARAAVRAAYPEVVVAADGVPASEAGRVQSWVIGPGMGTDERALSLLSELVRTDEPLVIDADAITLLARSPAMVRNRPGDTVLTPHDREFARIFGDVGADRVGAARRAAADVGAVVLLKGDATVVAAPDGRVRVNPTGTPWLATAGSGDVLSGLIGSLLASGRSAFDAASLGAYLHGAAGQIAAAEGTPTAVDVLRALRPALARVAAGG
jgi:hydroxyethylthiazole kinase-like uncharacterized protein yjeF